MLTYFYKVLPDDTGRPLITFPDVPEAAAVASDDFSSLAIDCLVATLQMYVDARRPLPVVRFTTGLPVSLDASVSIKLLLANEMVKQGVRKPDLAQSLGIQPPQIDSLLDLSHSTEVKALEDALRVLSKRLSVALVD